MTARSLSLQLKYFILRPTDFFIHRTSQEVEEEDAEDEPRQDLLEHREE